MEELLHELPLPTFQQFMFVQVALFTALMAILVVVAKNLFHSALSLVGTLFGVAGIYVLLEAEFLAVSQILVYVGGISTLITFAIMLTRSMMYGDTAPINRQAGTAAIIIGTLFAVLAGLVAVIPWPGPADALGPGIPISDVAALVAGETTVGSLERIAVAENELADLEVVFAEEEEALTIIKENKQAAEEDVTKAEEAFAEVQALLAEAKDKVARAVAGEPEPELVMAVAESDEVDTEEAEAEESAESESEEVADSNAAAEIESTEVVSVSVAAEGEQVDASSVMAAESEQADMSAETETNYQLVERGVKSDGEVLIAGIGQLFVTTYLVPFELMALLLLVVLAGAIMLARDRV